MKKLFILSFFNFSLIGFFLSNNVHASACCGGGGGESILIIGDFKQQASFLISKTSYTHKANQEGKIAEESSIQKVTDIFTLSLASLILNPYTQISFTLPFKMNYARTKNRHEMGKGIGDVSLQLAYEFLPELLYSVWKPRGFITIQQFFPTGVSIVDAKNAMVTDSTGTGHYATSLGLTFYKLFNNSFDSKFSYNLKYTYPKNENINFSTSNESGKLLPGLSTFLSVGSGVSLSEVPLRFGGNVSFNETKEKKYIKDSSEEIILAPYSSNIELGLEVSYKIDLYTVTAIYTDQEILNSAKNKILEKKIALNFTKFYEL